MNKLKPCPFCGGTPHFEPYSPTLRAADIIYMLVCNKCGAIVSFKNNETKEAATTAYNKRSGTATPRHPQKK